ncbi:MAG TPA: STAS domain-containing protein [Miltoncostaeaceae bacterium]|jgi:anti-anti-sigma factor|nr:STAS domain-containing protein [Miltoncostaeaceae bacterium]
MAIAHRGGERLDDRGPSPGSLSLVIVRQPGEVTCHARGCMDGSHAAMLERRLGELAREAAGRLVIDLRDVEYLGASGVAALLDARGIGEERGRSVVIRNHPEHAADALAEAGLLDRAI